MGQESTGMTHVLQVAKLEEQVEVARGHLDVLLIELDRRRHALGRLRTPAGSRWPLLGAGIVAALVVAVGIAAVVRHQRAPSSGWRQA
jgi:hypothetical protein